MKKIIAGAVFILLISGVVRAGELKEPFPGWNKLDSGAKTAWSKGKDNDQLELIIRTTVPVKKKQKKAFKLIDFKYRSIIPHNEGSIVTGSIDVKSLQNLASLEFVDVIEGGIPVSQKNK